MATIDLAPNLLFPHLYNDNPAPTCFLDLPLQCLRDDESGVRLLSDSSLSALALHPRLEGTWVHVTDTSLALHEALEFNRKANLPAP